MLKKKKKNELTISIISLSSIVKVVSAFPDVGCPLYTSPFFKSKAVEI